MQMQTTPIAFSGNIPVNYDSYLGPMFFEPYALDMADRISRFSPSALLELACGTGRLTKLLPAVTAKDANIMATDINPAMINYAMRTVKNDKVKWLEVDAVTLPFHDETFDCVVAQFGVMFYSNRPKAFKEAMRVLKPGGVFIFNAWDEIENNPMAKIANDTLQHFFPVNTPAFYSVPFSYFDEKLITKDLREAGFKTFTIEKVHQTGYSKSASNAAKGLINGTPTVTAIEDRDVDQLPLILEHLENQIAAQFSMESLKVPLNAKVITCMK